MPIAKSLLLSLALTACAGAPAVAPQAPSNGNAAVSTPTSQRTSARIGPPSLRGLGLRRIDAPSRAEPPIALY